MRKAHSHDIVFSSMFLLLVMVLMLALSRLPEPASVQLGDNMAGSYSLADSSFENCVYVTGPVWNTWPEKLYLPDELADAEAPVPATNVDYTAVQYATHQLVFTLVPGKTYGVSFRSSDYAMRLYINGEETDSMGNPAATAQDTVPQVRDGVYYFTPQSETVSFVVHAANFVNHQPGGKPPTLTIGTADAIHRYSLIANLKTGVIFGCLITACLYHLAIFLINRRQRATLVFAALCLLLAFVSDDFAALLMPAYNWHIAARVEYFIYIISANLLLALVNMLFPGALHKWVLWGYPAFSGLYLIVILATPSVFFTSGLFAFQALSIGVIVYGIVCLAISLREKKLKNILAFLGIALFALFIIGDILSRHGIYILGFLTMHPLNAALGMTLFVFCYAMVLSIERAEVDQRLEDARTALAEAEAYYRKQLKQEQSNGKPVSMHLDSFGLTKRESELTLLLLSGKSREEITRLLGISMGTVNTHCNNIYRKAGVSSVGELVGRMLPIEAASEAEKANTAD